MKNVFLKYLTIVISVFLFASCHYGNKENKEPDLSVADSLREVCSDLNMILSTDTLRQSAQAYLKSVPQESECYFEAYLYYIVSFFNEGKYSDVITLVDEVISKSKISSYPVSQSLFYSMKACALQSLGQYADAESSLRQSLQLKTDNKEEETKMINVAVCTMQQLMDIYVAAENYQDGLSFFTSLHDNPPTLIKNFCQRDVMTYRAYLAYRAGNLKLSDSLMASALKMDVYQSNAAWRSFRDYAYASIIAYSASKQKDHVVELLQCASKEAENCGYMDGLQWSLNSLANIYVREGRIEESADLYYSILDSARVAKDYRKMVIAYTGMTYLHSSWGYYKDAKSYVDKAVDAALNTSDSILIRDCYLNKLRVVERLDMPDSVKYYFELAKKEYPKKVYSATSLGRCFSVTPDDGIGFIVPAGLADDGDYRQAEALLVLAKILVMQRKFDKAEVLFDSLYQRNEACSGYYRDGVLEYVLDYYFSRNNDEQAAKFAKVYLRNMESRFNKDAMKKVTSTLVKYALDKKEQEVTLLNVELQAKKAQSRYYTILIIFLTVLIIGGIYWYLQKRKQHRLQNILLSREKELAEQMKIVAENKVREQQQELANALDNLKEANESSIQIEGIITELLGEKDYNDRMQAFTPSILRNGGEAKFRSYFLRLYPSFSVSLKELVPEITKNEEILCMLIMLKQSADEIANILCISKSSVNMARHRLRKKIKLDKEDSLEELIFSLV